MRVIYPLNDLREHRLGDTQCDCNPSIEFLEDGDMFIIHNSFDGREILEDADIETEDKKWEVLFDYQEEY